MKLSLENISDFGLMIFQLALFLVAYVTVRTFSFGFPPYSFERIMLRLMSIALVCLSLLLTQLYSRKKDV